MDGLETGVTGGTGYGETPVGEDEGVGLGCVSEVGRRSSRAWTTRKTDFVRRDTHGNRGRRGESAGHVYRGRDSSGVARRIVSIDGPGGAETLGRKEIRKGCGQWKTILHTDRVNNTNKRQRGDLSLS